MTKTVPSGNNIMGNGGGGGWGKGSMLPVPPDIIEQIKLSMCY